MAVDLATDDTDIMPWERQPRESGPAWEAFVMYRDMGLRRSLSKVAELLVLQSIGSEDIGPTSVPLRSESGSRRKQPKQRKPLTVSAFLSRLKEWSRTRNWRDRCEAYDREQDRLQQEALHEQLRAHQQAMAHPASVLLAAMAADPTLTEQLAKLVIAGVKGEKTYLPAIWRELMQVIQQGASGASQLVTAERTVREIKGEVHEDERGNGTGDGGFLADLPASPAILAGLNALGLGAQGYGVFSGVLRLGSDTRGVDPEPAPEPSQ